MSIKKNIEIISLIYKSVDYLKLICEQLKGSFCLVEGWDVGLRIVANDATEEVLEALKECGVPYSIYNDSHPKDFYLNRVYRAWNFAGESSEYDNICFVNSDMMFGPKWLENLLKYHDGIAIPCSRLVESGKLRSGSYGIERDFGKHPTSMNPAQFYDFVKETSQPTIKPGGLYMPCVLTKDRFIAGGMYPEGNLFYENGKAVAGYPNDRPVLCSGDDFFFKGLEKDFDMQHVTVFDSLVYHIQEGEKDE
jgi:hypothetical protein